MPKRRLSLPHPQLLAVTFTAFQKGTFFSLLQSRDGSRQGLSHPPSLPLSSCVRRKGKIWALYAHVNGRAKIYRHVFLFPKTPLPLLLLFKLKNVRFISECTWAKKRQRRYLILSETHLFSSLHHPQCTK